jgi:ELWxxDGT repeat protein
MTAGDDEHGRELWVSDGTEAGTMMLKDIYPGRFGGLQYGSARVESGGAFYFIGNEPVHGAELWKTDGTPEGTVMVKDVVPGRTSGYIEALTEFKGAVWFGVRGFPYDDQLWKSNGTEAGTVPVKVGFILGFPGLNVVDDTLIFSGNDFDAHGRELWRSDGTEAGTGMLQDLDPGAEGSDPQSFVVAGDRVFFTADDGTSDTEPWVARAAILAGRPRQGVQDLIDEVKRLGLPKGEENSLLARLNAALSALDDGRPVSALVALEVFANYVDVLTPRRLSEATAADLRQFAAEITGLLEGTSRPRGPKPKAAAPRTTGRPAGVTVTPVAAHLP